MRSFRAAAVCDKAVAAGIMASSSGRARLTPAPFSTVLRERCFLVTNIRISLGGKFEITNWTNPASQIRNPKFPIGLAASAALVQSEISDFGSEMQDSSNFHFQIFLTWPPACERRRLSRCPKQWQTAGNRLSPRGGL